MGRSGREAGKRIGGVEEIWKPNMGGGAGTMGNTTQAQRFPHGIEKTSIQLCKRCCFSLCFGTETRFTHKPSSSPSLILLTSCSLGLWVSSLFLCRSLSPWLFLCFLLSVQPIYYQLFLDYSRQLISIIHEWTKDLPTHAAHYANIA